MTKQHTLHLVAYRNFIIRNCFRSQQNEYTGRYQIENRKTARYCWIELNKFIKKGAWGNRLQQFTVLSLKKVRGFLVSFVLDKTYLKVSSWISCIYKKSLIFIQNSRTFFACVEVDTGVWLCGTP